MEPGIVAFAADIAQIVACAPLVLGTAVLGYKYLRRVRISVGPPPAEPPPSEEA